MSDGPVKRQPLGHVVCVEVIGPAGAGKTTFVELLGELGDRISPTKTYMSLSRVFVYLRSRLTVAHLLNGSYRKLYSKKERIAITRLEASLDIVGREASKGRHAVVFAQGPLFDLVMLKRAASRHGPMPQFDRWWNEKLQLWRGVLDVIICLDAPDDVLVQRISARAKRHSLKEVPVTEARAALARERRQYGQIIAAMSIEEGPRILMFDTSRQSANEMAAVAMPALSALRTP